MPNYYHNKLIIQGEPADLKQFKKYIGEDIPNDFAMRYLHPVPKDIVSNSDASSRWRLGNWGCKGDMRNITVLQDNPEILIINYLTPWTPNDKFIWFLSQMFNNLIFELIYFEGVVEYAGILIMYKNEWWDNIPLAFDMVDFVRNSSGKPYAAIEFDDEDDQTKTHNGIYKSVAIIGGQWEEELEDLDLNADNVSNWDEFIKLMNEIKKENDQNEALRSIGGLKYTKIYEYEPQEFTLPPTQKVIPPPLQVSDDEFDLPF